MMERKRSVLKLLVGIGLLLLCGIRFRVFPGVQEHWAMTLGVIVVCVAALSVIGKAAGELVLQAKMNDGHMALRSENAVDLHCDVVFRYLRENDIVDIVALIDGQTIALGVSAENERISACFTNKQYYIGTEEALSESAFYERLTEMGITDIIKVLTIDDMLPTADNFSFL